jgi:hypothetical protein
MASYQHTPSVYNDEPQVVSYPIAAREEERKKRSGKKNVWIGGLLLVGIFLAYTGFQSSSSNSEPEADDAASASILSMSRFSFLMGHRYRGRGHGRQHHDARTTSAKKRNKKIKKKDFWPLQLTGYPDHATQKQYIQDLQKIDWKDVKKDIVDVMTNSQPWWPADYGSYGGLFVRLSWHACGSYRTSDGRGGCDGGGQR